MVQLLKLRGFEDWKVAQSELEPIVIFGTARYSWYSNFGNKNNIAKIRQWLIRFEFNFEIWDLVRWKRGEETDTKVQ